MLCRWYFVEYNISLCHAHVVSFKNSSWRSVLDTTLCDNVCQWPGKGQCFVSGTLVYTANKTDHHDITELLLKVVLSTITPTLQYNISLCCEHVVIFPQKKHTPTNL
jgi:hypothetical protein